MADRASRISLIIGLALPALMVVIIACLVFLPSTSLHPKSDFVYVVGPYPSYMTWNGNTGTQHDLSVVKGRLTDSTQTFTDRNAYYPYPPGKESTPRFFIHRTESNTNEEISFEQAMGFTLSPDRTSPDGFTLTFGKRSYGMFPFFFDSGSDREHAYLSMDRGSKEITLISDTSVDYYSLQLVGWVIP